MTEQPRATAPLPRLRTPKASEMLADQLRDRILANQYTAGVGLPPEKDLIEQSGLGRTTVREALRILEVQGLVRMKSGRAGGAIVRHPGRDLMADTVSLLVRGHWVPLPSLLQTREAIEPYTARLTALHRTDADLPLLNECTERLHAKDLTFEEYLEAHVTWHFQIARASGNELLAGLVIGMSRAISEQVDVTLLDVSMRESAAHAHELVMQAIHDRDGDAAERRMASHVRAHREAVLATMEMG